MIDDWRNINDYSNEEHILSTISPYLFYVI